MVKKILYAFVLRILLIVRFHRVAIYKQTNKKLFTFLYFVVLVRFGSLRPLWSQTDFALSSLNIQSMSLPLSLVILAHKIQLQITITLETSFSLSLQSRFFSCTKSHPRTSHNTNYSLNSCFLCIKVTNLYSQPNSSEFQSILLIELSFSQFS